MPVSKERQRELREARKVVGFRGDTVIPVIPDTSVSMIPVIPVVPDIGTIEARLDKLEQGMASLAKALLALQREVGLIRKQQRIHTSDFNPEAW